MASGLASETKSEDLVIEIFEDVLYPFQAFHHRRQALGPSRVSAGARTGYRNVDKLLADTGRSPALTPKAYRGRGMLEEATRFAPLAYINSHSVSLSSVNFCLIHSAQLLVPLRNARLGIDDSREMLGEVCSPAMDADMVGVTG